MDSETTGAARPPWRAREEGGVVVVLEGDRIVCTMECAGSTITEQERDDARRICHAVNLVPQIPGHLMRALEAHGALTGEGEP